MTPPHPKIERHLKIDQWGLPGHLPLFADQMVSALKGTQDVLHDHDFTELVICTHGHALHWVDGQTQPLRPGDVLVIHPGIAHNYLNCKGFKVFNIGFASPRLPLELLDGHSLPFFHILFPQNGEKPAYNPLQPVFTLTRKELQFVLPLLIRLYEESIDILGANMLMTMACFYELLVTLARLYRKGSEKVGAVASSGFLLSDIISFLNAHYAENISIDKLAQEAYVSPRTFHRLFTAATGMPPKQYLLHLRVNRALSMLLHTNRTIKEIALSCGFSNSTHFYQRFTKLTGKGPLEMRRSRAEHMPHDV